MSPTTPAPRSTPKKPQDRQPKATSTSIEKFPEGWELLKPIEEIPAWDQAPLVQSLYDIMDRGEIDTDAVYEENLRREEAGEPKLTAKEEKQFMAFNFTLIGEMGRALIPFARDEAAYVKWASGPGALTRVGKLAMRWSSYLGESAGSESK